jgi:hypothetical protein
MDPLKVSLWKVSYLTQTRQFSSFDGWWTENGNNHCYVIAREKTSAIEAGRPFLKINCERHGKGWFRARRIGLDEIILNIDGERLMLSQIRNNKKFKFVVKIISASQ